MTTKSVLCLLLVALLPAVAGADDAAHVVSHDDVKPSLVVYSSGDTTLSVGGLLQLHLAPYVGDDSQLDDDDPANRAGFRLRRARLGVDAALPADLGFLLVLNPLESDPETGAISEARLSWAPRPWLRLWAGADKVPFSRGEAISSSDLASIERPLVVRTLVPQRRLGAAAEGRLLDGKLGYALGVMNATEGYELGNQFSGLLVVGRLQLDARLGSALGLSVGAGSFFEDGPATKVVAFSGDVGVTAGGLGLLVEAICDRTTPEDDPATSPGVPGTVKRCGGYAQASYHVEKPDAEVVVRGEYTDDNLDVDDAGDAWLLAAGVNWRPSSHVRLQLHYLGRYERHSASRANDSVVLALQGEL